MINLNDAGILAIVARMKRLYDHLQKDIRLAYDLYDLDFDPRWFPIIYSLIENESQSVTQLSDTTGMQHPNVIQLLKELERGGWLVSKTDVNDKRVRMMELSPIAKEQIGSLKSIWSDIRRTLDQVISEGQVDFWSGLLEFEASIAKKSFKERIMELKQQQSTNSKNVLHPGLWFDRPFDFEHLSTTPHGVLERLSLTPIRLKERVRNISEAKLIASDGKWSIKQNIGHLIDLEPIWLGRVQDILSGTHQMRGIDLTNRKTHEADHNYLSTDDLIANFTVERTKLIELCRDHFEEIKTLSAIHPRLGTPMRIIDLMYFVAEHDDHHLATIHHLLNK